MERVKGKWVFIDTSKYQLTWWLKSELKKGIYQDHRRYITATQIQEVMNEMSYNEDIVELRVCRVVDVEFEEERFS